MALQITITNAGRAEMIAAQNTGTEKVTITAVAFGTGQYTPSKAQTALQGEVKRLGAIAGRVVADDTIHVIAMDESNAAYNVGEFGLISDKGTLIAVYSQLPAAGWIIQKAAPSTLLLATDIILESLDASVIKFGDISFINPPGTVDTPGVVQLEHSLTNPSNARALTAGMGKKLQDEKQASDPTLTALAGVVTAANTLIYATGFDTFTTTDLTAFARQLLDDPDAANARATLGLGTASTASTQIGQTGASGLMAVGAFGLGSANANISNTDLNSLLRTGFYMGSNLGNAPRSDAGWWFIIHQEHGGLGYSSQIAMRLGAQAEFLIRNKSAGQWTIWERTWTDASLPVSVFSRSLLTAADAANARTTLEAQASDPTLTALAALTTAADRLIYATGPDAFAVSPLTAYMRSLLDDPDAASARATLGLGATDVFSMRSIEIGSTDSTGAYIDFKHDGSDYQARLSWDSAGRRLRLYVDNNDGFTVNGHTAWTGGNLPVTTFAKTLLDDPDVAAARATMGLGTAAVANVQTGQTGASGLMEVGAFGLGAEISPSIPTADCNTCLIGGTYRVQGANVSNTPVAASGGDLLEVMPWNQGTVLQRYSRPGTSQSWIRRASSTVGSVTAWVECVTAANFGSQVVTPTQAGNAIAAQSLSAIGTYAFARPISSARVFNQGNLASGADLLFSSTERLDGTTNSSGLIGVGTWCCHGATSGDNRTLWRRIA